MPNSAENAIQSDALEQQDNVELEAGDSVENNPRLSALEAIASRHVEALRNEGMEIGEEPAPAVEQLAVEQPDADEQLAAQLGQDDRQYAASDAMRVKVKVDGEEIELPLAEVVRSYQKDAAATRRLQEATRLLQLAEEKANSVLENNQKSAVEQSSDSGSQQDTDRLSRVKNAVSKLYEGDEDAAAKELLEIFGKGAEAPATHNAIDPAIITTQVMQQLEFNSAYATAKDDYPALFADDERGLVLGKATYERMKAKESDGIPLAQAVREATDEVATLFGIQKAGRQQHQPTRTARDEKLSRKAALDVPGAANVVAGSSSSPMEAPNVSSVIQEMAKARLGQSMNLR